MRAWVVEKGEDGVRAELRDSLTDDDLMPGEVTIDIEYSSINYKDGLALTGRPGVIREYPLIPGIDLVGTVASTPSIPGPEPTGESATAGSAGGEWRPGDCVILNGWGIGETHFGGLAERARVKAEWLVPVPEGLSSQRAAALGTAGLTAMLSVLALEKANALDGDVLVTGAAGGVGSITIALLASLGHRVVASTGRRQLHDYLTSLGAADVIERATLAEPGKPLQSQRFSGAIDTVGGHTLANALAQTTYGGTVASCGLAGSHELPSTVMPFILRAVTLTGINSVFAPRQLRLQAWQRLVDDLDTDLLDAMTTTIGLADAREAAERILAGDIRGRTVVNVRV